MNTAFEVTAEDVKLVMNSCRQGVSWEQAQGLFDQHIKPEGSRIEKAALHGNDICKQTEYAHQEIAAVLREKGVLKDPRD